MCLLLCARLPCPAADKVAPELRALAASEGRLPVIIALTLQPQRAIVRRVEQTRRAEMQAARNRVTQVVRSPFALPHDISDASAALDRIVLDIRRTALSEINLAIGPQQQRVSLLLQSWGAKSIHAHSVSNIVTAEVPAAIFATLDADPDVAAVFPSRRFRALLSTSVPAILAPTFWSHHSHGAGESVGVLDSGLMAGNPGFSGLTIVSHVALSHGHAESCFADDQTPNDNLGHGTHVAGIVASQGGGSCPTCVGVAPDVDLYNLKIGWVGKNIDGCRGGWADDADVFDAIDWAVANTAVRVFNYSYGGEASGDDDYDCWIFDQLADAWGLSLAIAAGNSGPGVSVESPAISYNDVAVASMDDKGTVDRSDDTISNFSSRGPTSGGRYKPDISAPGNHGGSFGGILSTYINGDYARMAGTSMATPHVAGALSLIRSAGAPDGLAAKAILLNTAYNPASGWHSDKGWGFVDLSQASDQIDNYFRASVTPGVPAFYAASVDGDLKSTLVWNRHVTDSLVPQFSNLSLYLYDGATGNALGDSTGDTGNVGQIVATNVGEVVLEVVPENIASGVDSEEYALAVSTTGFSPKNGPALSVSCTGPSGIVGVGAAFNVSCQVKNTGDLTAFSVSGPLNWQGSSGGTVKQFGSPAPSQQSSPQVWQMNAPAYPGNYTLEVDVASSSYGQSITGTTTVPVSVGQSSCPTTVCVYLDQSSLYFGATNHGAVVTAPQKVQVTASPGVSWSVSSSQPYIIVSPTSGTGSGSFTVSILSTTLRSPSTQQGTVTVTAPSASNSPQLVQVSVKVMNAGATGSPFGSFDTPANNTAGISGSIAVTGWALDSIGVQTVQIWRNPIGSEPAASNGLVYIGDATFVPGARPDVQSAYPTYPLNNRAGWGYLMLTNGLPNNGGSAGTGNGTYVLHAIATSIDGKTFELGTRTITCDNADATTPFGAIDTPGQGETVSGTIVNFGWALTPQPYSIPTDGSTISVTVDGVTLGHPVYNQYRSDIATGFPGYANANGAVGYFTIDTTALSNGIHTIGWLVYDNNGKGAGIGSRFFWVQN